ncbi:L-gulono-1,4-lactone dehydrogenase [Rhodococcus sp. MTM3W5.2]|uniref:D-arabinono-1,4-lactone oxidase n=1 Tax=Rhodococcus sp. MTM3W5.2 TaxID=1805827 RepID=UPI0009790F62|nr:D-arabinono-1,4-lactone oxidase [Rhodococcus sp. MTM3W5.2]AQA25245.1 L-gulono-1,4-lactone dehydrogenase [Rhodococcus sp. MTM3W5.2]
MPDSTTWTNFAGDQTCHPAALERPNDRTELAAAIERATAAGHTVRVAGGGHSFTDGVLTDGTLISLTGMDRVLDIDPRSGLVRCEAGVSLGALSAAMWRHGLAFANLGDIDVQSIAGATATGTHGAGIGLPNLSAALQSIELTLADGRALEIDASQPDLHRAARISLGALGVVSAVTLQAVPAFRLESAETTMGLDEVLAGLDEMVDGNDHFGFFAFGHSAKVMTKTWNRTDLPERPLRPAREWFEDVALTNYGYWGACAVGRAVPAWIPTINRLCTRFSGTRHVVDRSYRVFATPRLVPITEMEYAIGREHAANAVRRVLAVAERHPAPTPLEVRFVGADDALLSPAHERASCYIAVHQFKGLPWAPYFSEVERIMMEYRGRPHWGKRHFRSAESLRDAYPGWDRFAAIRADLDPHGVFTNPHLEHVLGPVQS